MSDALLGLITGFAAGAVMTRWGLCFNRAVRQAAFERRPRLVRAFAIAVALESLLLPVLIAAGVGNLERSADAGGPALLPVAQLVGGLAFGAGMALAGGCVTGMLWKAGFVGAAEGTRAAIETGRALPFQLCSRSGSPAGPPSASAACACPTPPAGRVLPRAGC